MGHISIILHSLDGTRKESRVTRKAQTVEAITDSGVAKTPVQALPQSCQTFAQAKNRKHLPTAYHQAYVEAMQQFATLKPPFGAESLVALGQSFHPKSYPNLEQYAVQAMTLTQLKASWALKDLFNDFGHMLPAAFYDVIIAAADTDDEHMHSLFKATDNLMADRIQDAALHGVLLVTPVAMHVQSVMSKHGIMLEHVMACGCGLPPAPYAPFDATLPEGTLKVAYLQNVIAATLEQYGVNAATMPPSMR